MEKITKYKIGLIIAVIVVIGLLFYFLILPRYNLKLLQQGYNQALNDYANQKAVPLRITQGNETSIIPVGICSQQFQENYQQICGVQG